MKSKTIYSLLAILSLSACGYSPSPSNLGATQDSDLRVCRKLQASLIRNYSGFNSSGISTDLVGNCTVSLTYVSGRDLLSFVDQVIAKGQNPLRAFVDQRAVEIKHEVIGEIRPEIAVSGSEETESARSLTTDEIETCSLVKDQFMTKLGSNSYKKFKMNGVGVGARLGGQCTISAGFETPAGYRAFVAAMVKKDLDPTSYTTKLNGGEKLRMHIDAFHIGQIVPQ